MTHSKEQNVVNDARCSLTWFENALREIGSRKHPLTDEEYKELKEIINKEADKISLALDAQVFENVDYSGWKEQPSIPSEWEFLRDKLVKMHNELDVLYDKGESGKGLRYAQGVLGYAVMHINAHTAYEHKQTPASNTGALEALDRLLMSYKLMFNNIELGTPKNEDGSKTFPPWLRDCRNDLKLSETIRTALTNPPAKTVDIDYHKDVLKVIDELKYIKGIVEKGENRTLGDNESIAKEILEYVKKLEASQAKKVDVEGLEIELKMLIGHWNREELGCLAKGIVRHLVEKGIINAE